MISFSKKECNDIMGLSKSLPGQRRDKNSSIDPRPVQGISFNYWRIPYSEQNKWIFNIFNQRVKLDTGLEVIKPLDFINMHKYSPGDKFVKHKDIYYPGQILNVGCTLNNDFTGGKFIVYEPEELLGNTEGKLYSFNNRRLHEVTEIKSGDRWSLIGFYKTENVKIKAQLL